MTHASRQVVVTVLAALAGLAVAVLLAVLTSNLTGQRIGLAGESPTAGRRLVAPAHTATTTTTTTTRPPPRTVAVPPTTTVNPTTTEGHDDDNSGPGNDGSGHDGDGDDDD
jgi:hypothetical protein